MKQLDYRYDVHVSVELTRAELERLIGYSQRHYDALCKSVSMPGHGSFLNGFRVSFDLADKKNPDDKEEHLFSRRELDITCKILEMAEISPLIKGEPLWWWFRQLLRQANEEQVRMNELSDMSIMPPLEYAI